MVPGSRKLKGHRSLWGVAVLDSDKKVGRLREEVAQAAIVLHEATSGPPSSALRLWDECFLGSQSLPWIYTREACKPHGEPADCLATMDLLAREQVARFVGLHFGSFAASA